MTALLSFITGFFLAGVLFTAYIVTWYFKGPQEIQLALFVAFTTVITPLVGFVVRLLAVNPTVGQISLREVMKNGKGNGTSSGS